MNEFDVFQLIYGILPAAIVGLVSFYFFHTYSSNEENRRRFLLLREKQKTSLPIRLQAYERLTLLLERISPGKLLFRVEPIAEDVPAYTSLLIANIEQEFEHNLAQQIYVSNECWDYIRTSKNAMISMIRNASDKENVSNPDDLRKVILEAMIEKQAPTEAALGFIKQEVRNLA
ncbi:hypothetical protein ACNI3T_02790 [Christiangramia sp. ASW11-125]|uniref:DUF7935 family protein n=1 Tax=Christiangramia sp. ASW11-125 TaxID=3400701 RepID=UPI003AAE2D89